MTAIEKVRTKAATSSVPWTVVAIFLAITALATKYVWDSSRLADRAQFVTAVQTTRDTLRRRIDTYENVLRAATGLFAANRAATRDDFRAYVQHLRVPERYPGIQGIGLCLRVKSEDLQAVVDDLRANDFPDFHVWPEEPQRAESFPIVTLEPNDELNRNAMGYDMHTSEPRRIAMDRARDSGEPAATSRVTLIQEPQPARKQPGFLIYVPVYRVNSELESALSRREQLYGFVYGAFRSRDLFTATIPPSAHPEVRYLIYDGTDLLYDSDPARTGTPRFTSSSTMSVAGRIWTIRFMSERTGLGLPFVYAFATCVGGITISFLLFAVFQVQLRARAHAERIAERLRQSEAELQRANRAKDEFLATLSHELRTPMTAILGWAELLAGPLDDEARAQAVDTIRKSGRAQAQLIDDLLDVSRITAGKMRIDPRPVDLVPIVNAAVDAVAPAANAKHVMLRRSVAGAPLRVNADPSRLQQVVWNLLTNAVKFTPSGGSVELSVTTEDDQAVVAVRDTGQGIDPAFLPHVFERFRQADSSTTRVYTGLGLGLAIVRNLVELHGGSVEAKSEGIGKGARFTVRLPLLDASHARPRQPRETAANVQSLHGVNVLVVDDEEAVRNYAQTVFAMSGANVQVAASANEALQKISNDAIDVVLTDIGMPEMDGYALLREIRKSPKARVPVIALTAYARTEDRELIEQAGFDGLVTKPVDPAGLRAAVLKAVS